ncbi:penicillin-insensitive murein endopeptidase, partial [Elizabethkingia anophelis]
MRFGTSHRIISQSRSIDSGRNSGNRSMAQKSGSKFCSR